MNTIIKLQKILEKEEEEIINEKMEGIHTAIDYFDEIIKAKEPNRAILEALIDIVWINHDKSVRFDLKPDIKLLIL